MQNNHTLIYLDQNILDKLIKNDEDLVNVLDLLQSRLSDDKKTNLKLAYSFVTIEELRKRDHQDKIVSVLNFLDSKKSAYIPNPHDSEQNITIRSSHELFESAKNQISPVNEVASFVLQLNRLSRLQRSVKLEEIKQELGNLPPSRVIETLLDKHDGQEIIDIFCKSSRTIQQKAASLYFMLNLFYKPDRTHDKLGISEQEMLEVLRVVVNISSSLVDDIFKQIVAE